MEGSGKCITTCENGEKNASGDFVDVVQVQDRLEDKTPDFREQIHTRSRHIGDRQTKLMRPMFPSTRSMGISSRGTLA